MIKVDGDLTIGTYNENPVNVFAPSKTDYNTTITVQPQVAQAQPSEEAQKDKSADVAILKLNPNVNKVDFLRVINAMCELEYFHNASGGKAYKKDVFAAFGRILGENFTRASSNLSSGLEFSVDTGQSVTETVFDSLKEAALEYNSGGKNRKHNK